MDSQGQRPTLSALGVVGGSARSSSEYGRSNSNVSATVHGGSSRDEGKSDSRIESGASPNAADILKDLAALQKEVDAARRSAGR